MIVKNISLVSKQGRSSMFCLMVVLTKEFKVLSIKMLQL